MPFLELNGWSIPISDGGASNRPVSIGKRGRAFDGSLLSSRRARKGRWQLSTPPVTEMVAEAIIGAVDGLGQVWPFDFSASANLTPDFFGTKGEALINSSVGSMYFGIGADGDPVVNAAGMSEAKYGTGSATNEAATTNLLAANQRDVEDGTTFFNALAGGSIANSTSHKIQGTQSLQITTTAIDDGAETSNVAVTGGTSYTATVYVKASVSRAVRVRLLDNQATSRDTDVTLAANKWTRISVDHETHASATAAQIQLFDRASGGTTLYMDALQLEAGSIGTAWADPTRPAGGPVYAPGSFADLNGDVTISAWARSTSANHASERSLLSLVDSSATLADQLTLTRLGSANTLRFESLSTDGTSQSVTSAFTFDGSWHLVTGVLRRNPETGENSLELFVDGVSNGTPVASASALVDLTNIDRVLVGDLSSSQWTRLGDERIDDAMIVPWAAPATQVLAWFNMGVAMSKLPRLHMSGDVIPQTSLTVEGQITDIRRVVGVDSGNAKTNLSRVQFVLEEV